MAVGLGTLGLKRKLGKYKTDYTVRCLRRLKNWMENKKGVRAVQGGGPQRGKSFKDETGQML